LAKQDELRKKINDLQKQSNELEDEKIDLRRIHDSHPVAVALNNLYSREQGADTSLSQEVQKMALDDAKLKEIVLSYAAELNIKLNEKEIEATIKDIKLKMKTSTPKE